MTSKTTAKTASPKTSSPRASRKNSQQQSRNKPSLKHSVKKSERINRQRRLQKQLQALLLERHSRRCIICHHPEREAIEEEFVHWRAPWKLSQDYKLNDYRTVYRHARAVGLLLERRERLHSALDAFVESVDDVTFTGDTILRAMRAYSCIDSHGRWTEIPTQVQFSTSNDPHPPQPPPRTSNVHSDVIDIDPDAEDDAENALKKRVAALRASSKSMSREDQYDELEDDDSAADADDDDESEEGAENELEELVTATDVLNVVRKYANQRARSDATADESEEAAENELEKLVTSRLISSKSPSRSDAAGPTSSKSPSPSDATACAAPPTQPASAVPLNSNNRDRSATATACADSSAQALPRDVGCGQNPNDRSPSDCTDCAALPRPSTCAPAQPAAPPKPKPDADGRIWQPRPGYPDQEISEPDAQGRVQYKIQMTTAASQPPSRKTDAQRAAKLIYGSVIKKYGNP